MAPVHNPIPERLARVVSARVPALIKLGKPGEEEVYVTAADDIRGCDAAGLSSRLGIRKEPAYYVIEFDRSAIDAPLTSPVQRAAQCFVGGGRTRGGAREFIVPNQPIPDSAKTKVVN